MDYSSKVPVASTQEVAANELALLRGVVSQMDKRLDNIERRLDWLMGIVFGSWITIVGLLVAVLLKMK